LEYSSVCVVDANGKILREARVASEPEALIAWFRSPGFDLERIGLEAGPLSQVGKGAPIAPCPPIEVIAQNAMVGTLTLCPPTFPPSDSTFHITEKHSTPRIAGA
jgi:hypothetical protein